MHEIEIQANMQCIYLVNRETILIYIAGIYHSCCNVPIHVYGYASIHYEFDQSSSRFFLEKAQLFFS